MAKIDNEKMWGTLIEECNSMHDSVLDKLVICIRKALLEQDLCYEPKGKIKDEKVKWYVCTKEYFLQCEGEYDFLFEKGKIYKTYVDDQGGEWITADNGHSYTFDYSDYFRPATEEEILEYNKNISTEYGFFKKQKEEPKQEWSEEDETGWTNTMIMIKECAANHYNKDSIKLVVDWLESLKDRVQPQPKQEWSENDKRIIDNLISQLGNLFARKLIKKETKDKYVNWLKSLRPKNTWKPSNEQMAALESVINNLDIMHKAVGYMDNYTKKHLEEILEQLKEL